MNIDTHLDNLSTLRDQLQLSLNADISAFEKEHNCHVIVVQVGAGVELGLSVDLDFLENQNIISIKSDPVHFK